jgi:hypothetical protein
MEIVSNAENIMKQKIKNPDAKENHFGRKYSENKTIIQNKKREPSGPLGPVLV